MIIGHGTFHLKPELRASCKDPIVSNAGRGLTTAHVAGLHGKARCRARAYHIILGDCRPVVSQPRHPKDHSKICRIPPEINRDCKLSVACEYTRQSLFFQLLISGRTVQIFRNFRPATAAVAAPTAYLLVGFIHFRSVLFKLQ